MDLKRGDEGADSFACLSVVWPVSIALILSTDLGLICAEWSQARMASDPTQIEHSLAGQAT